MEEEDKQTEPETEEEKPASPVTEEEIPVKIRMAAARLLASSHVELRTPKARMFREEVGAWLKENRNKPHPFRDLCAALGFSTAQVMGWQHHSGIDVGLTPYKKRAAPRERVYMEEHTLPEAPTKPPEEKIASQFTLRVIEMTGDNKTVEAAVQGLREFLQRRSN